jgi:hypothetical protein
MREVAKTRKRFLSLMNSATEACVYWPGNTAANPDAIATRR